MSNFITWLHISDLHFCSSRTGWDATRVLATLCADLKKMEQDHGVKPDFIFFTGDVAFGQISGSPISEQFNGAAQLFEKIRTAFATEVPKENFFIVPGNHDVNREFISDDQTEWLDERKSADQVTALIKSKKIQWTRYMERLSDYRNFLDQNGYVHLLTDPSQLTYSINREVRSVNVGIAGFNSAWSCGRSQEKGKLWMAGHWQIENVLPAISSADIKIALMHHPSSWLVEFEDSNFRRAIERDFDFCLHGHEHQEWIEPAGKHTRIAAGACYDSSSTDNGYNLVQLDVEDGIAEVWLRRYDSRGGGWVPDVIANKTNNDGLWSLTNLKKIDMIKVDDVPSIEATSLPLVAPLPKDQTALSYLTDLPPVVGAWVGREDELKDLKQMLTGGVVAVTGIGGQGKSSLIAKFLEDNPKPFWNWRDCRDESERFQTQLIASIEHFTSGELTGEQLASSDTKEVVRYFFQKYSKHPGIFIFDNVDQYVNVDEKEFTFGVDTFVDEALRTKHEFLIIFTCRPRVAYPNTRFLELHLEGLSFPEAMELFRERRVKTEDNKIQAQVKGVWERTEGHPLWMDLIATQMERNPSSASKILEELNKGQVDDRALSMFKALWKGLHMHQQAILRCMAEMMRPETQDSIRAFTTSLVTSPKHFKKSFNGLQALSLLVERKSRSSESKYDLHPLVRSFINKEFSSKTERQPFLIPLVEWLNQIIFGRKVSIPTENSPQEVIEDWVYKAELEISKNDPISALKTLSVISEQLSARGLHEELFRVGILILDRINWNDDEMQENREFHNLLSVMPIYLAEHKREKEARNYLEKYEDSVRTGTVAFLRLCDTACRLEWTLGNFEKAVSWGRKSVNMKESSQIDTQFDASANLALALRDSGEWNEALKTLLPEQDIEVILSDDHLKSGKDAPFYGNIGRCLQLKGDTKAALICFVKSANLLYVTNDADSVANRGYALLWTGELLENMHDYENAYAFYRGAANIWEKRAPLKAGIPLAKSEKIEGLVSKSWSNSTSHSIEAHCQTWIENYFK